MESHNYTLRGYNISEVFRGVLDALAYICFILLLSHSLGVADAWNVVRLFYILGAAYMTVRCIEFSDKVFQEVFISGSEE